MSNNKKIKSDLIANYFSLIVLGLSGLVINFIIGRFVSAEALGVFNQLFTIYIIASQFSVVGIQFSMLTYLSRSKAEGKPYNDLILGALAGSVATSIVVFLILWNTQDYIAGLFGSKGVEQGISYVVLAVFFFGINKVLINILNACREMVLFGFFQAFRMILILASVLIIVGFNLDLTWLAASLAIAEVIEFFALFIVTKRWYKFEFTSTTKTWIKRHMSFGAKGVLNGGVSELNSRVDILVIGIFLSDTAVGIYTMASTVVEGMMQIPAIVRNVINPILSEYWFSGDTQKIKKFISQVIGKSYLFFFIIGLTSIVAYNILVHYIVGVEFAESVPVFIILVVGLMLSAGFMPLDMILIQLGYPLSQSLYKGAVMLVNIVLNIVLIQLYGLIGVAIATAISFVVGALLLGIISKIILLPKQPTRDAS